MTRAGEFASTAPERARRPQQHHDRPILVGDQMVHRIIDMGRGQPFLPDHELASFPPFLIVGCRRSRRSRRWQHRYSLSAASADVRGRPSSRAYRFDCVAAVTIETLVQFLGCGDQAGGGSSTRPVGRVNNPDETVALAIFYSLDTSPDVGAIKTIKRAMDRSARDAFSRAGPRRKHDVPVRSFVQSREMILPDLMVFAQEPGDDAIGGFALGVATIHPRSPC